MIDRRGLLTAAVAATLAGAGAAQRRPDGTWINQRDGTMPPPGAGPRRDRKARTIPMFKSPPFGNADDARRNNDKATYPNALAIMTDGPGGLWIGEQKMSGPIAGLYPGLPDPTDLTERAWLVDWNGKVLKTVTTPEARNTGGMAYGDGCLWRSTEYPEVGKEGIYQTDLSGRNLSFRQIPMGPPRDGGGSHGAMWVEGKLWIVSNRLRGLVRIDPKTWTPDWYVPAAEGYPRFHGCAWDNGTIWQVAGNASSKPSENKPNLVRYDVESGDVIEIVEFVPGSSDPHGLTMHDGVLISCDAGNHPNWPIYASQTAGMIFRIELV